nr:hypothetical protein [uncultured Lacibacter sp.]
MKLQVTKNIQFTRLIKADGRLREFNFRKLGGLQEGLFSVDVADERGNRLLFKMHKEDSLWKIVDGYDLPDWVTSSSTVLHERIEEVLNTHLPQQEEQQQP